MRGGDRGEQPPSESECGEEDYEGELLHVLPDHRIRERAGVGIAEVGRKQRDEMVGDREPGEAGRLGVSGDGFDARMVRERETGGDAESVFHRSIPHRVRGDRAHGNGGTHMTPQRW